MLHLSYGTDCITYTSGIAVPASFTRYSNHHWDRTAADLLCGVADVYEDVGLIAIGDEWDADLDQVMAASSESWSRLSTRERRVRSLWERSKDFGWLFVPGDREAVEDMMSWSVPYLRNGAVTLGLRSIVFPKSREFRSALDSAQWTGYTSGLRDLLAERCVEPALFEMMWNWDTWSLYPKSVGVGQLLKLAEPVVAQIDAKQQE